MLNRPFCGTCAAFDNGVCRFAPPAAFPLGMAPPNLAGGQPRMITGAAFPRVKPEADWCMQHMQRPGESTVRMQAIQQIMNLDFKVPALDQLGEVGPHDCPHIPDGCCTECARAQGFGGKDEAP